MENNEFKKVCMKNCSCYYFDDIVKLEDLDLDSSLIHAKSHENVLIYDIKFKTWVDPKPLRIRSFKTDGFIRICDGLVWLWKIWCCLWQNYISYNPKKPISH